MNETSIDFEAALNAEQLAVVTAPDGPLFVLAAAGTGKTRTLVYRVAYLVERGVDPQRVLLLTFTNKAAREMMERAESLVGGRMGGLWGGTFHHMANRMLRRYGHHLGYGLDFTILDQDDTRTLMRSCLSDLKLKSKEFPKPDVLHALFSGAVNKRRPVGEVIRERYEDHPVDVGDVLKVHTLYEKRKRDQNAMDFDDLLINSLRLLQEQPDVLTKYQDQFIYVMVDEYQDTNPIQAEWVDLIAAKNRNLLVVGDDFQSIYAWRGADYRNIMTFPRRYPDAKTYKLETNYRSVPEILTVANSCIAGNPGQFQKTLRPTRAMHQKPMLAHLRDGQHQARYIVQQMYKLRREGRPWTDITVLYRAHYHAMELQMVLARERIPYVVTSGVRFFEQAHIKDACSLLRIMHNAGDELAFSRLVELLPGVGPRTTSRIWGKLNSRLDIHSVDQRKLLLSLLPAEAQKLWQGVDQILDQVEHDDLQHKPGEIVRRFIDAFYDQYCLDTFEDHERRVEDLQEMVRFMETFATTDDFLNEVALVTNLDADLNRLEASAQDAVRLSTVHQAKGLEWGVVFILWAVDGMFPSGRSLDESGGDEEERRLFYVAVTRAKDELYLCMPETRRNPDGGVQFYTPSRFVKEIPPDMLRQEKVGFL